MDRKDVTQAQEYENRIATLEAELAEALEAGDRRVEEARNAEKKAVDKLVELRSKLAEARRDGERYQALYQMAQVSISGFIVFGPMLLPNAAKWDGTTARWDRDIFDAAVDAARGGAK